MIDERHVHCDVYSDNLTGLVTVKVTTRGTGGQVRTLKTLTTAHEFTNEELALVGALLSAQARFNMTKLASSRLIP